MDISSRLPRRGTSTGLSPRSQALAFRIWCAARVQDWDVSFVELAEALDVSPQRVAQVVRLKGWCDRFRATAREITRSHQIDGPFGLSALMLAATEGLPAGEEFHG